jgi:hypothetical protein
MFQPGARVTEQQVLSSNAIVSRSVVAHGSSPRSAKGLV